MKVRELLTSWIFDIDNQSLDRMDKKIGDLRNNARAFGANMKSVTDGMVSQGVKLTAFVTVPIVGMGAAMIKAASDAEETESKFATVFKDISAESETVAAELAKNFGLASDTSKKLLSDTGDLLTGFGFTGKSALDLSKDVQALAVDLASFTNFSGGAEGASAALTKALLGERESVKSLGISILEEDVKAKIAALEASGKLTNESERQKKAIATLAIATEQSKNAIGDFARTSDQFANQQRILGQRIRTVAISFGKILIPFALKAVKAITALSEKFEGLSKNTKEWIVIGLGVVAVLAPMLLFAGLVGSAILAMASAFTVLKAVLIAVQAASLRTLLTWLAIPILVVGIGLAIAALLDEIWVFANGGDSALGFFVNKFIGSKDQIMVIVDSIIAVFKSLFDILVSIGNIAISIGEFFGTLITGGFKDIINLINGGDSAIKNWLDSLGLVGEIIEQAIIGPIRIVRDIFIEMNKLATGLFKGAFNLITGGGGGGETAPGEGGGGFTKGVTDLIGKGTEGLRSFFGGADVAQATVPPAPNIRPANPPPVAPVQNNNINPTINMTVPAGSTDEQVKFLEQSMETAAENVFNKEVRKMVTENPENN